MYVIQDSPLDFSGSSFKRGSPDSDILCDRPTEGHIIQIYRPCIKPPQYYIVNGCHSVLRYRDDRISQI